MAHELTNPGGGRPWNLGRHEFDSNEPSTVTDANGNYSFTGLSTGNYTVLEVVQAGWVQTYPSTEAHAVTIEAGQSYEGLNFGNQQTAGGIQGTKWQDTNGDGKWSAGEPALAGWTIFLDLDGNGQPGPNEPSTVTDSSGNYAFTGLAEAPIRLGRLCKLAGSKRSPEASIITSWKT